MTSIADILAESSTDAPGTSSLKQHIKNVVGGLTEREKAILELRMADPKRQQALQDVVAKTVAERRLRGAR